MSAMRATVAAALVAVVLAGCGSGGGSNGSAGSGAAIPPPDLPVGVDAPPGFPGGEARATRVEVVPGAVDLRPQPFETAEPVGERQLALRFWGGVAPCFVVGRVDVAETPERVTLTVFGGRNPRAGNVACIELAVFQEVVADLAAPVGGRAIADGAR